jgi:hypothetical protein
MKRTIKMILLLVVLIWVVVFLVGRIRWPIQLDQGWSPPVAVTSTENGFHGGGDLYKWHDTLILVQSRYDWSSKSSSCSIMVRNNDSSNSWTQLPISDVPGDCAFYSPALDQTNDRIMFERGHAESNQLHLGAIFLRVPINGRIQIEAERKWTMDKKSLFGETGPNVTMNDPFYGKGVINDSNVYIPYCLDCTTVTTYSEHKPFNNGVFYSTDLGTTWQMEKVSDSDASDPSFCRTEANSYYFANGVVGAGRKWALWSSRKSTQGGSWNAPIAVTRTIPIGVDERYSAVTEGDTIHVCWLDNRHEIKYWFSLARSGRGNYEVAYCRRMNSDTSWRKNTILSRGIMFAYLPSMSVEGDKIVVAWAGAQTAHAWPFEGDPSDIYYATSKDGGKTWSKPLQVTDHFKDGITSGSARVALQNGVIHLFYAQGKYNRDAQVSQQGGWPVYYQQRPFPE